MLNKTISKSGQKQAKKKKKQGVLESPKCYYILSTVDICGFSYPSYKRNLNFKRYSEFPVNRDNQGSGPGPCLSSTPQLNFIKYPADTEHEREKKEKHYVV